MDEAVHFGHHDVVTILRDYHTQYSPQDQATEKQDVEKNLDGMLWWTERRGSALSVTWLWWGRTPRAGGTRSGRFTWCNRVFGEGSWGSLQDEKLLLVLLNVVGFFIDVSAFILNVLYLPPQHQFSSFVVHCTVLPVGFWVNSTVTGQLLGLWKGQIDQLSFWKADLQNRSLKKHHEVECIFPQIFQ